MHVRDRVYGIETEYSCMLKRNGKPLDSSEWPKNFLRDYLFRSADRTSSIVYMGGRTWHSNGSLSYIDTGDHPEHASAEARSVYDAVIYSQAGDRMMRDSFCVSCDDGLSILLFKNNIAPGIDGGVVIFGCHENYLAHLSGDSWIYSHPSFISFIVSRQILDGTGSWDDEGNFFLSQRARCVGGWRNVPMLIGTKSFSGTSRIHLTYGDSSMLDMSVFLKIGATSLMLSLLEQNGLPDIVCTDPMGMLREVSESGPHERVMYLVSGAKMSAYEIQVRHWEAVRHALQRATFDSDEVAAESKLILNRWEQALNAIGNNDIPWMLGRIDWATKRWLVEQEIARHPDASIDIRNTVDLFYHSIGSGSIRERIHACWPNRRLVTDREIISAMIHPPAGTRAQMRSAAIRMAIARSMQHELLVDWHRISSQYGNKNYPTFEMNDPLNSYENSLELVERMFEHRKRLLDA